MISSIGEIAKKGCLPFCVNFVYPFRLLRRILSVSLGTSNLLGISIGAGKDVIADIYLNTDKRE